MNYERVTSAGPGAKTSVTITTTYKNKPEDQMDQVAVHTTAPLLERRTNKLDQAQIYNGDINLISIIDMNKDILCCKFTEDTLEMAAGFADGVIHLFDSNKGMCTHTLADEDSRLYPGPVTAIEHKPVSTAHPITNTILASYSNGCIKCWKYRYDQCVYTIREKRQTLGIKYHPKNPKFVSYGDDSNLIMYNEEAQTQERSFYSSQRRNIVDGHVSRIFACAFHPNSHHELISGGWDDYVMCWDDRQPYATRYFEGPHICGEGLDFVNYGRQVVTCSWQDKNSLQVWDYASCKLIETIESDGNQCRLYCGRAVPHTDLVVCGGSDCHLLRVVDIKMKVTECAIRNNPGAIFALDFGSVRRKPRKQTAKFIRETELPYVPRVLFVTGKRLQVVDFG